MADEQDLLERADKEITTNDLGLGGNDEPAPREDPPVEEPPVEDPPVDKPEGEKPDGEQPPPQGEDESINAAPKSWKKELAAEYAKLSPSVKSYIHEREKQAVEGISQYKAAAAYGQTVSRVVSPYHAHIQSRGVDVPTALNYLLNADYTLSRGTADEKAQLFTQLAQDYGVDLSKLGKAPEEKDPAVRAMEERLAKTEGALTDFQRSQQDAQRKEIETKVNTFASDPKNIYFNELSADIAKLINAGYTLEDAYEKAIWANPVTRQKEIDRTSKEREAAAKLKAEEAAKAARRAARSNVKETPSPRSAPTGLLGSMDDTLRSTLRNIKERT